MPSIQNLSISKKLILASSVSAGLALFMSCLAFVWHDVAAMRQAKIEELVTRADILAFNASAALTFRDAKSARSLLASLSVQSTVDYACLYDTDGKLLADYRSRPEVRLPDAPPKQEGISEEGTGRLQLARRVREEQEVVGSLVICETTADVQDQLRQYRWIATVVMLCSLATSVLLSSALQRTISAPVKLLAEIAQRITNVSDYSIRVSRSARDELGELYAAFNQMLEQIESSKAALRAAHDELEQRVEERTAQLSEEVERRQLMAEDLRLAKDAAETANRAKSAFLANMSHEIRTPLNGILGFTDLLLRGADGGDPRERLDFLQTIATSGRHLLDLINDILDLSKIEAGQLDIERLRFAPHQVMLEVVSVLRVRAVEKGITLDYEWESLIPETIVSDPARFRQLLTNLVGNAIKFTSAGRVTVVGRLERDADAPRLAVDVIDTGIGIPADKLERVFEPFVQADSSVTRRFGGTGLGLAICRQIAHALGGSVSARSEPGRGSIFSVRVATGPLEGVRLLETPSSDGLGQHAGPVEDELTALPPCRVLLVEDGDTNRKLIGLVLRRAGAEVLTAENGQVGLEMALRQAFDLVLMDMQMPVLDGYSATRRLRDAGYGAPIVALTAHAMKGDDRKCYDAGCNGYLTKPIDPAALLRTVHAWIGSRVEPAPPLPAPAVTAKVEPPVGAPLESTLPLDDADFREIVSEFVARLAEQMQSLETAAQREDFTAVRELAHWLKGAGGTAGFAALTEPAARLEAAAVENSSPLVAEELRHVRQVSSRIAAPTSVHAAAGPLSQS